MTVKPFTIEDLGAFVPNEYSNPDDIFPLFLDANYVVRTLWGDDNMVQAIICFRNYWGRCWSCFVLLSKGFIAVHSYKLRNLMSEYMDEHNAVRLETVSRAEPALRRWHEWMGFTMEGTRRKMMFNRDYDMWAIVREGV